MTIELFKKVLTTIMLLGVICTFINGFVCVDFRKLKYHTYSTIPTLISFLILVLIIIWE
jgi:hypothetical protein